MKHPRKDGLASKHQYCNLHLPTSALPSSVLDVHTVPEKYTDSIETSFAPFYFSQ